MNRGPNFGEKSSSHSYRKIQENGTQKEADLFAPEDDSWLNWGYLQTRNGFYLTLLTILVSLIVADVIVTGILWKMKGGTFTCVPNPLLSGQMRVGEEQMDVFQIVDMAATSMEFESALVGTRLDTCSNFCKKSFNVGEYACKNDFCSICHVSTFDSYSATPYELCISSCECCMQNKCSGKCESFVSSHACGFDCKNFGYGSPASCVQ